MRPGDVLTMYDGQTVEVTNTDAEGRLILADALAMAAEDEPDADHRRRDPHRPVHRGPGREGRRPVRRRRDHRRRRRRGRGERRDAVAAADPRRDAARRSAPRARSPTCCSTTGCGGARRCSRRRSSSEFVGGQPWAHLDIAGPAWNTGGPWGHVPVRCHRLRHHHAGGVRRRRSPASRRVRAGRSLSRLSPAVEVAVELLLLPLLLRAVVLPHPRRGSRPARRRTTARRCGWRTRAPTAPTGTRRRVHSPSWATSSSVTSVTVVRGSTKPSTPRRVRTNSSRCRWSASSEARTVPPRADAATVAACVGTDRADPWAQVCCIGGRAHGNRDRVVRSRRRGVIG